MIGASHKDKAELAAKKAKKEQQKAAKPVVPQVIKMAAPPTAQPIKGAGGQATKQVAAVRQDIKEQHPSKSGPEQQKKPLPKASLKQVIGGSKEQKAKKNKG